MSAQVTTAPRATSRSTLTNTLRSRDTDLMARALGELGAHVDFLTDTTVAVTGGELHGGTVDCGLAGTVMRFLPPLAATGTGPITFDGDADTELHRLIGQGWLGAHDHAGQTWIDLPEADVTWIGARTQRLIAHIDPTT